MNNKGFAFSTMLYGFMIVGCLLFLIILGLMSTNRTNTREMINSIEDDSGRVSVAGKIISAPQTGKVYYDFDVPLGYGGWYKIEVWGRNSYAAKTVNLKELTVIRIFLSSNTDTTDPTTGVVEDTSNTKACSMNRLTAGSIGGSYSTEEAASAAYDALKIKEYLKISDCSAGDGLIVSSGGNGSGTITQVGDGIVKSGSSYKITSYSINNSTGTNYFTVNSIDTNYKNRARVTFVSNESTIPGSGTVPASTVCKAGHAGIYYIKRNSDGKFKAYTSPTNNSFATFTGERRQKWLVTCKKTYGNCGVYNLAQIHGYDWTCPSGYTYYNAVF